MLGLLKVSVAAMLATVRCSDIYTSLNLSNEVILVMALTLCQFGIRYGIPLLSPRL